MRTPKARLGLRPSLTGRAGIRELIPAAQAERDFGHAVTTLYLMHYRSLVRLASLLVFDLATAEDIVQDSFAAVHGTWHGLPDTDAALCYLRRSVVHRSRSVVHGSRSVVHGSRSVVHRSRSVVHRSRSASRRQLATGTSAPDLTGAGPEPGVLLPSSDVMSALRALPVRQREVLVLRYFADLSEAEIASATGRSTAAVKGQIARGMCSLRAELRPADE